MMGLLMLFYSSIKAQDTVKIKSAITPEQQAEMAYNLGLDVLSKKDYNEAIENFSQALQLNPAFDKAYYNRGFAKFS